MSEGDQQRGERRRRPEAERSSDAEQQGEQPLTRRELRAREAALATGALQLDSTGEIRVVQAPDEGAASDAGDDLPATGTIGLTRRELRALREQQAAAAAAGAPGAAPATAAEQPQVGASAATPHRGLPVAAEPRAAEPSAAEPSAAEPSAPKPSAPAEPVSAPEPPPASTRRPVVRPPATAGSVRGLTGTGAGLAARLGPPEAQPTASPSHWPAEEPVSVDVTSEIAAVSDSTPAPAAAPPAEPGLQPAPGPLPTTRRSRRLAGATTPSDATTPAKPVASTTSTGDLPSIDAVIAGRTDEPEPFTGTPAWAEMPPPTPSGPLPAVPGPAATDSESTGPQPAVTQEDRDEQDQHDDDHGTPRWLMALMILVLVVIGIVLGLLVWRMIVGEGTAGAVVDVLAWKGLLT